MREIAPAVNIRQHRQGGAANRNRPQPQKQGKNAVGVAKRGVGIAPQLGRRILIERPHHAHGNLPHQHNARGSHQLRPVRRLKTQSRSDTDVICARCQPQQPCRLDHVANQRPPKQRAHIGRRCRQHDPNQDKQRRNAVEQRIDMPLVCPQPGRADTGHQSQQGHRRKRQHKLLTHCPGIRR